MMPRKSATFRSYRIRRLQHSGARGDLDFSSSWTKVRAEGPVPWIRRELRSRGFWQGGEGLEQAVLLHMRNLNMLQLMVVD